MSKIVELKVGELQNVVGGISAANTADVNASLLARQPGGTTTSSHPRPQVPTVPSGTMNPQRFL